MFTCGSPVQRSAHSRKAYLYLEMNQGTHTPQMPGSDTLQNRPVWCIRWRWSLWSLLGHPADHHWRQGTTIFKKASVPASWLKETREIAHTASGRALLWSQLSQQLCVKKNATSTATADVFRDLPSTWCLTAEAETPFHYSLCCSQRSALLLLLRFPVWKGQCPEVTNTCKPYATTRRLDAVSDASTHMQRWGELCYGERSWRSPHV